MDHDGSKHIQTYWTIGPLVVPIFWGDDGDEYPFISCWGGDQGTRVLTLQLKDTQRKYCLPPF